MKYLLLSCCLLFTFQVSAQGKKKSKSQNLFHIQGGFLLDNSFEKSFTGFNLLNIGLSKVKNNKLRSFQLELIGFEVSEQTISNNTIIAGYSGRRLSAEVIYNYSFALSNNVLNGFFYGPSASFIVNSNLITPKTSASFPFEEICYCLGIGVNSGYNWSIGSSKMLSLATRITLLDVGLKNNNISNPILTEREQILSKFSADFLRDQFQLMVGLNFNI